MKYTGQCDLPPGPVNDPVKIGNVLRPVADVDTAMRFYIETFGLAMKFVDGDRYAALGALVQGGGAIVREPEQGPHEVRAVARDPWGNTVVIYGPR